MLVAAGAAMLALLVAAGVRELGPVGLLLPVALVIAAILVTRPVLTLALVVGLTIFCEGPEFGLFSFSSNLYLQLYKGLSLLDVLVALVVISAFLDVLRNERPLRVPRPLAVGLVMLALAMLAGAYVGHKAGTSLRFSVFSEHVLFYLLLVPLAIANLDLDARQIKRMLAGAMVLAVVKAIMGLVEIALRLGKPIEGSARLTYYEPTANWVIMIALLAIVAALLLRVTRPRWILLSSPLLIACLLFSYRRSFWIAAVLGLLLVILFGTSPIGRRLLVPASLAMAVAIWLLGSLNFQSNLPLVKRVRLPYAQPIGSQPRGSLPDRRARERCGRDQRTPDHRAGGGHPVAGNRSAAVDRTRRRPRLRSLRRPVVLAQARRARPVRLRGDHDRLHRARVAGVATVARPVAAGVRARIGVRDRRADRDGHDRQLHRGRSPLHGRPGGSGRPAGAAGSRARPQRRRRDPTPGHRPDLTGGELGVTVSAVAAAAGPQNADETPLLEDLRTRLPRVAIVHEWLTVPGGSEQVVLELLEMFPAAELFTSIYDPEPWPRVITERPIHTSALNRIPGATRHYPKLLPLMDRAFRSFDLSGFDLVISSNHACAKNVHTPKAALHVCYCHTPMRYAWEESFMEGEELGRLARLALPPLLRHLRKRDLAGAASPDVFVANSRHVAERIARYYGRPAEIVHPPVNIEHFLALERTGGETYLVFGRVVPYKRVDLAVAACERLGRRLQVAGDGRALPAVRAEAAAVGDVQFLGRVDDAERDRLLSRARALLFPGEEDFGIVPVEAQAAGVPVIAYRVGGASESVLDGKTGILFDPQERRGAC